MTENDDRIFPSDPAARSGLLASIASAIVPGAGQFLLSDKLQGSVLCGCLLALACCLWPLRLGRTFPGLVAVMLAMAALFIISCCLAMDTSHRRSRKPSWAWLLLVVPLSLFMTGIYANVLLAAGGLRAYTIASSSMEPTIFRGDRIMADLSAYRDRSPQRGDLVVFRHKDTTLIKRLIGLPGDRISSADGVITRNGKVLDEPYAVHRGQDVSDQMQNFAAIEVPDGQLFVLGDNRDASLDSRLGEFGELYFNDVLGKAAYVIHSSHTHVGQILR